MLIANEFLSPVSAPPAPPSASGSAACAAGKICAGPRRQTQSSTPPPHSTAPDGSPLIPASNARNRRRAPSRWLGSAAAWAAVLLSVGLLAAYGWRSNATGDAAADLLTAPVTVGRFVHEVVEAGEIESSSNVEVRCEVATRNGMGSAILEIVPEGTLVEAGDLLARLDDSALQNELLLQQIVCNNSLAAVVQAETAVETARLARREYESGSFKQQEEQLHSDVFVAEENLRRAEEYFRYSERLAAKGYVTPIQLEADRFAMEKAAKDLGVARTKLEVLRNYTREKVLRELDASVKSAEARLRAVRESHQLDAERLEKIRLSIEHCTITAPSDGQVVYANDRSRGVVIEEGYLVRERQVVFRLPDPRRMQVLARINEARVDLVKSDMPVRVQVDALPGVELQGIVRKVNEFPLPTSFFTAQVKQYATLVEIRDPPPGLRPGMTAQVAICVEQLDKATQVPVQAVFEHAGRHYCLTPAHRSGLEARPVTIGAANGSFVVVRDGLRPSELVVMHPQSCLDRVQLPGADAPEVAAASRAAQQGNDRQASQLDAQAARQHSAARDAATSRR